MPDPRDEPEGARPSSPPAGSEASAGQVPAQPGPDPEGSPAPDALPRVPRQNAGQTELPSPVSDAELVARVRGGDDGAFELLYRRHADAVRRYARTCCRDPHTAEDLTGEVFARTLQALRSGSGPAVAVRPYLLTAVRRVAATWGRTAKREQLVEDFAVFAVSAAGSSAATTEDTTDLPADVRAMEEADQSMAVQAFRSLPERWQTVLWHTAVERESPSDVAPLLGLTANATAVLAHRAREGLRQAYLQAHVSASLSGLEQCGRYADRLGAYARGALRVRADRELRKHLDGCARCRAAYLELADVNACLRGLLPVAFIGWWGAGYAVAAAKVAAGTAATAAAGAAGATGGSGGNGSGGGAAAAEGLGTPAKVGIGAAAIVVAAAGVALAVTLSGDDGERPHRPAAEAPVSAPPVAPPSRGPGGSGPEQGQQREAGRYPGGYPGQDRQGPSYPLPPSSSAGGDPTLGPGEPRPPDGQDPLPGPTAPAEPRPHPTPTPRPPAPSGPSGTTGTTAPSEPRPPSAMLYHLEELRWSSGGDRSRPTVRLGSTTWVRLPHGMSIGGTRYRKGVTVRAPSWITINLNRRCSSFDAVAGIDDAAPGAAAARFEVYGDGIPLYRSHSLNSGDAAVLVHATLRGYRTMRLVVRPAHHFAARDLADWANSQLRCR